MAMLPQLQAERQLQAIEAASVPHMTEQARGRLISRHVRRARAERPKTAGEALATLPIPVIYEPPKGGES
jgi:hypothetical protein